jgi:transcriptional regulator with XRE-family HTH domain
MTLGERIQTLRHAAGLTQEQLSSALEVSRQAVSKWESGEAVPELAKLIALSALFGVSLDELVRGEAGQSTQRENAGTSLEELARRSELGRQKRMGGYIAVLRILWRRCPCFSFGLWDDAESAGGRPGLLFGFHALCRQAAHVHFVPAERRSRSGGGGIGGAGGPAGAENEMTIFSGN